MRESPSLLLCIDLQVDPDLGLRPEARAIFAARQLLTMGRRLGWTIAHARRRLRGACAAGEIADMRLGALRPLKSERVFFRNARAISESPALVRLLEAWRGESVLVAAFDQVALLSCLLACYESGPRVILVEDAMSLTSSPHEAEADAFRAAAWQLAGGLTSVGALAEDARDHVAMTAPLRTDAPEAGEFARRALP